MSEPGFDNKRWFLSQALHCLWRGRPQGSGNSKATKTDPEAPQKLLLLLKQQSLGAAGPIPESNRPGLRRYFGGKRGRKMTRQRANLLKQAA